MLDRRDLGLGLGAAFAAGPAFARNHTTASPPVPDDASVRARRDVGARMTIAVKLGEAGPFQFVVDTGADISVIASEIADALDLPPGREVRVHGLTGAELVRTVKAPPLGLGSLTLATRDLPAMPRERIGGDGLLGMDVLKNNRLVLDFRNHRMEIRGASSQPLATLDPGFVAVPADDRYGRLTVIRAVANTVAAKAFVDSGATMSIANPALARAMQAKRRWTEDTPMVEVAGVTDHVISGEGRVVSRLQLGALTFNNVPVVVADLHLFQRWNLGAKPAILLGIDVLRLFARVELDYGRRRMLFRTGGAPAPELLA